MAKYKVIDTEQLETDLESVADAIRSKSGTSENLAFPEDFVSTIEEIETGRKAAADSKYYSNNWDEGSIIADAVSSGTIDFFINEEYPENRIITDVSVRINEDDSIKEYTLFELYENTMLGGSTPYICTKAMFNEAYSMFSVAMVSNLNTVSSEFYSRVSISDESIVGFTVYYIEI